MRFSRLKIHNNRSFSISTRSHVPQLLEKKDIPPIIADPPAVGATPGLLRISVRHILPLRLVRLSINSPLHYDDPRVGYRGISWDEMEGKCEKLPRGTDFIYAILPPRPHFFNNSSDITASWLR